MLKIKITKKESAVAVIIREDDSILLLKRPNWVDWSPGLWAFPGGKVEDDEGAKEAAVRETKEETQLEILNLQVVPIYTDKPVATYYTRDYTGAVKIDWEHDDWAWVHRKELHKYEVAPQVEETYEWVLENG
tara:strand:- start:16 stop:411 length:396 start_codon:yes stop_codon:yes gene_type:complete